MHLISSIQTAQSVNSLGKNKKLKTMEEAIFMFQELQAQIQVARPHISTHAPQINCNKEKINREGKKRRIREKHFGLLLLYTIAIAGTRLVKLFTLQTLCIKPSLVSPLAKFL